MPSEEQADMRISSAGAPEQADAIAPNGANKNLQPDVEETEGCCSIKPRKTIELLLTPLPSLCGYINSCVICISRFILLPLYFVTTSVLHSCVRMR